MADNTIANAIKFLKGEEKSLPTTKTEGQVYFAYKNVGTAEKPSYTGAIYIDTPIGGTQTRIKMTANADVADKAFNDASGLSIRDTYLSGLGYTDDGKQTILIKGSGNNQARVALPIASTSKSGIVTTDAQSFSGTKTFVTINSNNLTVSGSSGFNYTGIETGAGNAVRPVWFAYDGVNGKPVINTNFTYNPATQTLKVANLSGTADRATNDGSGQSIRSTYISSVEVDKDNKYKYNFKTPTGAIRNSITIYDEFQKRSNVDATTDWNTLTSTGIYKVQMSAWGDATKMHSPNSYNKDLYSFGILLVFESIANDSEKRFTQIYIPHSESVSISSSAYKRMHNGSDITTGWQIWHPIARGLHWNEISNKPNYAGSSSAGGAATSANKLNTNAGSTTLPVYFSGGIPVACSTNLGVSITGNAASATKLTSSAGSVIQPIYFKDGKPVATTYSLNATVKAGVRSRLAFYSETNEISSAGNLKYYTATNTKNANQTVLRIWGDTCGNTASNMISGEAGALNWNDGGPQIQFSTSETGNQDGALIFTDNDSSGIGASFHFVSNQNDWSVNSKRFVARTSIIIGQETHTSDNQGYNLYVNGTAYIKNILTAIGDCNFIAHGNEFNFVPTLKAAGGIWFNYRQTGGQPTNSSYIIDSYSFGNGANKALATITDGLFSGAATYVRDSNNKTNDISITYSKAGQASTSWLASWNGYELGAISPNNITAGKATILATARKISLTGDATGSATFNGGTDISISTITRKTCFVGSDSASTNGWYKVASQTMSGYGDSNIMFAVTSTYGNYYTGIFSLQIRANNTSIECPKAEWLVRSGFSADSIKIVISGMTWTMYVNKLVSQYGRIMFEVLSQSSISEKSSGLTMYNTSIKESATPSATKTSNDGGTVSYANSAYNSTKWNNYELDLSTNNTTDTWLLVANNGKIQHRLSTSFATSGHTHSYLPLSGGTMNGTAFISWADTGNWNNNNSGVKFPVNRGGLQWSGQSDGVSLYAVETANDNLELYLRFTDDNSNGLSIINSTGSQTARITSSGAISGTSFTGPLNGNAASATTISSMTPTLSTGIEKSAITVKTNDNAVFPITNVAKMGSIRTAIDFQWYDSNWQIGNIRGDSVDSVGFGFAFKPSASGALALKSYIDTNGAYHGNVSGNASTATKLATARTISLTGSVTGSGSFDGSGNLTISTSTNHSHSQYLPLAGGTMTGTINFNGGTLACNFRSNNGNLASGIMHQTYGTEALVFATTNTATSFIFKCGQKPTSMANNTWANITPSMQIKSQSVYINSLIGNGVTPAYNLYVNGSTRCNGTLGVGNGSNAEIDFFPSSSSTINARIKAYSDRIEFVFS